MTRRTHLHTLQRFRQWQLDSAQAEHVQRQAQLAERQQWVEGIQTDVATLQERSRGLCTPGAPLSVDSLTRARQYLVTQIEELTAAAEALRQSELDADRSHAAVQATFEQREIVERLSLRRARHAAVDAARCDQKQLDDQALLRRAAGTRQHTFRNNNPTGES
jgi:hypothetical protein